MTEGDPLINLTTTRIGSAAVVTVEGELDLHTARTLMGTVDDTLTTPDLAAIVIDLSGGDVPRLVGPRHAGRARHPHARPAAPPTRSPSRCGWWRRRTTVR